MNDASTEGWVVEKVAETWTWESFMGYVTKSGEPLPTPVPDSWWESLPPMPTADADEGAWHAYVLALEQHNERSRRIRAAPDGKTLHIFNRATANDDWSYSAVDTALVSLQNVVQTKPDSSFIH